MPFEARHNIQKCMNCSACLEFVACPGAHREICIGCGACTLICPHEAIDLVEVTREKDVCIDVDGVLLSVPEMISVKEALGIIGYQVNDCLPAEEGLYAPCGVGACWNCAVHINGEVRQACVTEAREGMKIRTDIPKQWVPLRIVGPSGGLPHGGVGTPWDVRKNAKSQYLEICCIVAGCNFRCPQCHNWMVTHMGQGRAYTPQEAAAMLTRMREKLQLNRFCLSGGEITLNRVWLVQLLKELRTLNPYPENHLHISTNGSLLTEDYIDELIDAGLNDFGIDLKGFYIDTFMKITGLQNKELAQRCKETAWSAVSYITHHHREKVFLGVGIPYNKDLISLEEIQCIGKELHTIDPFLQTTAMSYFNGYYRSKIVLPSFDEMKTVHTLLQEAGLKTVQAFSTEFIPPSEK